jgi:hypothetical protein
MHLARFALRGSGPLAFALLLPASVLAEEPGCGSVVTPEEAAAYLAAHPLGAPAPTAQGGATYWVPIAPHIVRQSDGTLGLPEARYWQAVADANLHYEDADVAFYTIGPIDFIDSDAFYWDIDTYSEIDALRTTSPVVDAINIYFTEVLDYENGALCGISAFTFSSVQAIAMRNSCTANDAGLGNHSTFSHEIGHYFDLFHTHETAFGGELVDGTNCTWAGDLVCDTPADPVLTSSTVDSGTCLYTGSATDSNGDPYAPDCTQLMSYSLKHCRDNFSPESLTRIQTTLLNDRTELLTNPVGAPNLADAAAGGARLSLSAPRPNPAPGMTEMQLSLGAPAEVDAVIHDVRGARVRTIAHGLFGAGTHTIGWDGRDGADGTAAPGIYFARVTASGETVTRKLVRVR